MVNDKLPMPNDPIKWKNRRHLAWFSFGALMGIGISSIIIGIHSETTLDALTPIISVLVMAFSSIIGAYMGLATWADKWSIPYRNGGK